MPGYQNVSNEEAYSYLKAIKHWDNKDAKAERVWKPKQLHRYLASQGWADTKGYHNPQFGLKDKFIVFLSP